MNQDLHHLSAAYALDALDADERAAFEAHYPTCEICSAEVNEFRDTAAVLADEAQVPPPAALKARIMAEAARTRQLPPILPDKVVDLAERRRRRAPRPLVVAAAAAALVVVVSVGAILRSGSGPDRAEQILAAPDALVTSLEGGDGTIRVVWSAERDEIAVFGNGLPDPGPGSTYELWFVLDEGVAPAGLFEPDTDGIIRTVLEVDDIAGTGWAITVEPDGGSPQPTGDIVFSGPV